MSKIYKRGKRLTVHEAAEGMGIAPQTLRIMMQRKLIDVGLCFKLSGNKYTYLFDEGKLRLKGYEIVNIKKTGGVENV